MDEIGNRFWLMNGPTIKWSDGCREWIFNGRFHREDGPAVEYPDGYNAWYIHGKSMANQKVFQSESGLSDEEMVMLILKYGEIK